jgi:hypothetical protein
MGKPNTVGLGIPEMPSGPPGQVIHIDEQEANDFTKAQGNNGQVVAAQAQYGETQQEAKQGRHTTRQRQRFPEAPACVVIEQGVGIGTYGIKTHKAQVQQAGKADHNVQPQAQHDVDQHQGGNVHLGTTTKKGPDHGTSDHDVQQDLLVLHAQFGQGPAAFTHLGAIDVRADQLDDKDQCHADKDDLPIAFQVGGHPGAYNLQAKDGSHNNACQDSGDKCIAKAVHH